MRLAGDHPSGVLLATVPPLAVCEGKVAVLDHVLSVEEGGEGRGGRGERGEDVRKGDSIKQPYTKARGHA